MYAGIHKVSGHPLVSLLSLMAILDVFVDPHEKILRTHLVKAGTITIKFSEKGISQVGTSNKDESYTDIGTS